LEPLFSSAEKKNKPDNMEEIENNEGRITKANVIDRSLDQRKSGQVVGHVVDLPIRKMVRHLANA
jgi:hypothetical protein